MRRGYAVLDFETTGLAPARGDRVLEVGAIYMNPSFSIDGGIETLVNPQRDVGPTHVHGITARDVFDAPTFDRVAPGLLDMLDGRVIVGHNISFDLRFLVAELEREGYAIPDFVAIDTLQVSRALLKSSPPPSYKLHDLAGHLGYDIDEVCDYVGLERRPEHSAFGDALVTGFLLTHLAGKSANSKFWETHLDQAELIDWPERFPVEISGKRRGEQASETVAMAPQADGSRVETIAGVLTALGAGTPEASATAGYSKLLDAALEDRILEAHEVDALVRVAENLGLDAVTLGSLHRGHFDGVVRDAWRDGVLDEDEREDIMRLALLLGIDDDSLRHALEGTAPLPEVAADATADPDRAAFPTGSIVVLTGDMSRERSVVEARLLALGFAIGSAVTKKTAIVIAADPYTQSGKAKKARSYGIPILGEAEGLSLLGY